MLADLVPPRLVIHGVSTKNMESLERNARYVRHRLIDLGKCLVVLQVTQRQVAGGGFQVKSQIAR